MNKYPMKTKPRDNKLWIGMYMGEDNNRVKKPNSYRMKVQERDRLKLEREEHVWENLPTTVRT